MSGRGESDGYQVVIKAIWVKVRPESQEPSATSPDNSDVSAYETIGGDSVASEPSAADAAEVGDTQVSGNTAVAAGSGDTEVAAGGGAAVPRVRRNTAPPDDWVTAQPRDASDYQNKDVGNIRFFVGN